MRKWHRWLSVVFAGFLLWIAATGVLSQVGTLVNNGGFERARPPAEAAAPAGFVCPETMVCRSKPGPRKWDVGLLHQLHSGESFGPVGTAISLLSGAALLFFAFSGLWVYVAMWRNRARRGADKRWFWD